MKINSKKFADDVVKTWEYAFSIGWEFSEEYIASPNFGSGKNESRKDSQKPKEGLQEGSS